MKTYQTGNDKRRNFFRRHKNAIIIAVSVIAVTLVVVLSVVLTRPEKLPDTPVHVDDPVIEEDPPVENVVVEPKIVAPMSGAAVGLGYANDRLVYWDTLELWRTHPAVDFVGDGNVVAVMDGKVTAVDMHTTLEGNVVTVTHDNGYVSVYKSLGDEITVKVGDSVKAGDKLGVTSDSMMIELKTGSHLHLEMKKDGKYIDPATVLPINNDK